MTQLTRRQFLTGTLAALAASSFSFGAARGQDAVQKRWYKGNLHMHNQWSDGAAMPEYQIDWYRSRGYNFVCPSDHNTFQTDELRFVSFGSKPKVTKEISKALQIK